MQVNIESLSPLERRMTISVPADQVEQEILIRLKKQAQHAKIKGFRPGKVPLEMLKLHYGAAIRQQVIGDLIQSSFQQAANDHQLEIAGAPRIKAIHLEPGQALEYEATFEVYEKIDLKPLTGVKIEKQTAVVTEADLEKVLNKMRQQAIEWLEVNRAAQLEDRLMVDIVGTIDGVEFSGGTANDVAVVLGSKSMIAGFEEGLIGAKISDKLELDLTFPEEYPQKDLAGKPVHFTVKVRKIMEPKLPVLDDAFAKNLDVADLAALRIEVRTSMERELERNIKEQLKRQVLTELCTRNPITVPQALVDAEIEQMQQQLQQRFQRQTGNKQPLNLPKEHFAEQAKERVLLGLLLNDFIKQQQIAVDNDRVNAIVKEVASGYENPEQIVTHYYQNRQLLMQIEAMVLEEQAVAKLLEKADVEEKQVNYEDLVKHPN
jgi:trigger factor